MTDHTPNEPRRPWREELAARVTPEALPCGHPLSAATGDTTRYCGTCADLTTLPLSAIKFRALSAHPRGMMPLPIGSRRVNCPWLQTARPDLVLELVRRLEALGGGEPLPAGPLEGWVVELEPGVWIAPGDGDPGRALAPDNAQVFESVGQADAALYAARKFRPFPHAQMLRWERVIRKDQPASTTASGDSTGVDTFEAFVDGPECPHHFPISRARARSLLARVRAAEEAMRFVAAPAARADSPGAAPAAPAAPSPSLAEALRELIRIEERERIECCGCGESPSEADNDDDSDDWHTDDCAFIAAKRALAAHDAGTLALAPDGTLPVPEGTLIEVTLRGEYATTPVRGRNVGCIRGEDRNNHWLDTMGDFTTLHPVVRLAAPQPQPETKQDAKQEGGAS